MEPHLHSYMPSWCAQEVLSLLPTDSITQQTHRGTCTPAAENVQCALSTGYFAQLRREKCFETGSLHEELDLTLRHALHEWHQQLLLCTVKHLHIQQSSARES